MLDNSRIFLYEAYVSYKTTTAREMAQMPRVLGPLSEDLGSVSRTQIAATHNHLYLQVKGDQLSSGLRRHQAHITHRHTLR